MISIYKVFGTYLTNTPTFQITVYHYYLKKPLDISHELFSTDQADQLQVKGLNPVIIQAIRLFAEKIYYCM